MIPSPISLLFFFINKAVQATEVAWTAFYCASASFRFAGLLPQFADPVRASRPSPGGPPKGQEPLCVSAKWALQNSKIILHNPAHGRRCRRPPRSPPVSPFCKNDFAVSHVRPPNSRGAAHILVSLHNYQAQAIFFFVLWHIFCYIVWQLGAP